MYFIMEQNPGGDQLLDYKFYSLDEAKAKKLEEESAFPNSQCNYYILKLINA